MGRQVKVEAAAEIVAKKLYQRGDRVTARDLLDLSLVIEREADKLVRVASIQVRHRRKFLGQISKPGQGLLAAFELSALHGYQPSYEQCASVTSAHLKALPSPAND
jgi:menaquinone-dependent protoporphyrinogen IX oxidase